MFLSLLGLPLPVNDIVRFTTVNDSNVWDDGNQFEYTTPYSEELTSLYLETSDINSRDINWYRALAAYKIYDNYQFPLNFPRAGGARRSSLRNRKRFYGASAQEC